jgi:hypothetical protein
MLDASTPNLLLDDALFPGVLDGSITASIRIGDRKIEPGRMTFAATNGNYLPLTVFVSSVIKTTLIGIADVHARRAGHGSDEAAMAWLREKYPEANPDTPMTVILFERAY